MVEIRYKKEDFLNKRLAQCMFCGSDIFYLSINKETRVWWHERSELDADHDADPVVKKQYLLIRNK